MRLLLFVLTCAALASCAPPHIPQTQVSHASPQALARLQRFKLIAPASILKAPTAFPGAYPQLASLLSEQLQLHGYRQAEPAQINVYYWLAVQERPLEFKVDQAPPSQLGAYLAIHRLQDETGTLRLRLTDQANNLLWEGTSKTGLSPASYSAELLKQATQALTAQIPASAAP